MPSLPEYARLHTALGSEAVSRLEGLVASWGMLADLCFSDLLLWSRETGEADRVLVLAHVRPTTSQTIYRTDLTGESFPGEVRPLVSRCIDTGEIIEGEIEHAVLAERVRVLAIPVCLRGEPIAVLTRESAPSVGRQTGELEQAYVAIFNRFATMIAAGDFPFSDDGAEELTPRVGDGLVLLDAGRRVEFSSPNAVSALVRAGVRGSIAGQRFDELGVDGSFIAAALVERRPVVHEIEAGPDITVAARCLPLLEHGVITGAIVLLRDISELRSRDRLLVSKDATIREIHHRVKNNLQTISSLLRLQSRRLEASEAKDALEESVRRIRSIALVHETLSREAGEDVAFVEIVRPLVRMVEEGLISPDQPIRFRVVGDAGKLPATIATPLAVVLTELLQNVVDHAFPPGELDGTGEAIVELGNDGDQLSVEVVDDGVGLAPGFSVETTSGLGLQIVRTLVTTELEGTICMRSGDGPAGRPGTVVVVEVPVGRLVRQHVEALQGATGREIDPGTP